MQPEKYIENNNNAISIMPNNRMITKFHQLKREKDHEKFLEKFEKTISNAEKMSFSIHEFKTILNILRHTYFPTEGFVHSKDTLEKTTPLLQSFLEQKILSLPDRMPMDASSEDYTDIFFYIAMFIESEFISSLSNRVISKLESLFLNLEINNKNRKPLLSMSYLLGALLNAGLAKEYNIETIVKIENIIAQFAHTEIEFVYINDICTAVSAFTNHLNYPFREATLQALSEMLNGLLTRGITSSQLTKLLFCFGSLIDCYWRQGNSLYKIEFSDEIQNKLSTCLQQFFDSPKIDIEDVAPLLKGLEVLIKTKKIKPDLEKQIITNLQTLFNTLFSKCEYDSDSFAKHLLPTLINLRSLLCNLRDLKIPLKLDPFYEMIIFCLRYKKAAVAFDCWLQIGRLIEDRHLLPSDVLLKKFTETLSIVTAHKRMSLENAQKLLVTIQLLVEKRFFPKLPHNIYIFFQQQLAKMLHSKGEIERENAILSAFSVLNTLMLKDNRAVFVNMVLSKINELNGKIDSSIINQKYFFAVQMLVKSDFVDELTKGISQFIQKQIFSMLDKTLSVEEQNRIADLLIVLSTHKALDKRRSKFADELMWDIKEHPNGAALATLISQKLCQTYQVVYQPYFYPIHFLALSPHAYEVITPNQTSTVSNENNTKRNYSLVSTFLKERAMFKRKRSHHDESESSDYERESKYRKGSPSPSQSDSD